MKKKLSVISLLLILLSLLAGCACEHEWDSANCVNPQSCKLCGETEGEPLGHSWKDATCTEAKTCSVCGISEGDVLAHVWQDATCASPKTCTLCHQTEGTATEHEWVDATCTVAKTCANCGKTEGTALGHEVTEWITVTEPTCQAAGSATATCVRCDTVLEKETEMLPHTESDWTVVTSATSDFNGLRQITCTVCGDILKEEEIVPTDEERAQLYKHECENYSYDTIARNPDKYKNEKGYVYGRVIQVIESGNDYTLRVAMNGSYSAVILVSYTKPDQDDRILEDDWVKMYGIWYGTYTYESTMGASITVPLYFAEYLYIQ